MKIRGKHQYTPTRQSPWVEMVASRMVQNLRRERNLKQNLPLRLAMERPFQLWYRFNAETLPCSLFFTVQGKVPELKWWRAAWCKTLVERETLSRICPIRLAIGTPLCRVRDFALYWKWTCYNWVSEKFRVECCTGHFFFAENYGKRTRRGLAVEIGVIRWQAVCRRVHRSSASWEIAGRKGGGREDPISRCSGRNR